MTGHPLKEGRTAGVLLHITSLPGPYGTGDLGSEARWFAKFLSEAGQRYWQVLPLNPPAGHAGSSPYDSVSAFAGNPLLISPGCLVADGWIDTADLPPPLPDYPKADFPSAFAVREALFDRAFSRFSRSDPGDDFTTFCRKEGDWLEDYARFVAISASLGGLPWTAWPAGLRDREPAAIERVMHVHQDSILREKFIQFLFAGQWERFHRYCERCGVELIGDLPIFVSQNSADVWAHRSLFRLDAAGMPEVVAGVPPDYFSRTGQRWGNPLYRWEVHEADGFAWWRRRVQAALDRTGLLRMDHFRGFSASFAIPAATLTAETGQWDAAPGDALFSAIRDDFPSMPFIAEDLGIITPDVRELKERLGLPGMKVLLFAFGGDAKNPYLPHHHVPGSVVYTGTHDNATAQEWFHAHEGSAPHRHLESYTGCRVTSANVHEVLVRLAYFSVSRTAIIPVQDLLGLGPDARMNSPGTCVGNWLWRLLPGEAGEVLATHLSDLVTMSDRRRPTLPGDLA